ncbi:MAG: sucrase ferredoxin [Actinobacteria bacterium]|nr:sucrase ferredoxin [Actinomycetota bacterium]
MARERGRAGCAAESRARSEDLLGTASRVRRWLLVEQPGPWGRDALTGSRLDEVIARTVASHARRSGVRVLLIRRPGWRQAAPRRVFTARTDPHRSWLATRTIHDPRELVDLDLDDDDDVDRRPAPGEPTSGGDVDRRSAPGEPTSGGDVDRRFAPGEPASGGIHLVCTHGRHDPCCADEGRPVVRALHAAGTPDVWETSHVGGDRFAANVVCLPSGVYFGRVPPADAARIVADHDAGLLDLGHYRGRCCFPPLVQAAEIFARRELDEPRLCALDVRQASVSGDGADVVVHHGADALTVRVAREPGPPELLTCADGGASAPWRYRLVAMTQTPMPTQTSTPTQMPTSTPRPA